jgi:hypothetical protein
MACALEVAEVKEAALIAVVLRDILLCRHDVVDVGAGRAAFAEHCDLAQRIALEHEWARALAPLL